VSVNSIIVQPSDIAMLGDDIRAHLRHFSAAERMAVALYLLSQAVVEIAPEDHPDALALAAQAMAVGLTGAA
jgi:hypothetical protein